ncbi:envelope stress sensor histidine kinase CpxA, partial [Vibrio sp. 10N.222.55.E8]
SVPTDHLNKLERIAKGAENRYAREPNLGKIIFQLEMHQNHKDSRPRIYLTDREGNVLTSKRQSDYKQKAIRNFVTLIDNPEEPKQKLYGHYMIAGPVPITLAGEELLMYAGIKWNQPPPFLLRLFDKPLQLLLAVMLASTPL